MVGLHAANGPAKAGAGAAPSAKRLPSYSGASVAAFYAFMSIASVFMNKALFEVYHFNFPMTLVLGQTLFTFMAIVALNRLGLIRQLKFNVAHFRRVGALSALFLTKLVLDMSALALVNIPMYGVLKSATTPFVLGLDYVLRSRTASTSIQLSVIVTTLGGLIAGAGDLTFDVLGYALALASALSTAGYVVVVGQLGDDLNMDSMELLQYNCLWSLPLSAALVLVTGEWRGLLGSSSFGASPTFVACFLLSCASALILNWVTYLCTLVNDSLTTSIVGRTKSILQGFAGLFTFGVQASLTNIIGLLLNSAGIAWYAYEKSVEHRRKAPAAEAGQGGAAESSSPVGGMPMFGGGPGTGVHMHMAREDSQLVFVRDKDEDEEGGGRSHVPASERARLLGSMKG